MKTKKKEELLKLLLEKGVEPNSSNIYAILIKGLEELRGLGVGNEKVSFNQILKTLTPLSSKWDKEIDKIIKV